MQGSWNRHVLLCDPARKKIKCQEYQDGCHIAQTTFSQLVREGMIYKMKYIVLKVGFLYTMGVIRLRQRDEQPTAVSSGRCRNFFLISSLRIWRDMLGSNSSTFCLHVPSSSAANLCLCPKGPPSVRADFLNLWVCGVIGLYLTKAVLCDTILE